MQSENKEKSKVGKLNKKARIAVAVLACLVLVGVSYTVYSKYYKTGYNRGMSIASGFYFNSNYMAAVDELRGKTEDDLPNISNDVLESVIISANKTSWTDSPTYLFQVEVRNYDNHLLYNDKELDVEYEVHFMLLNEPLGAAYSVSFGGLGQDEKELTWENGRGEVVTYQGELPGGSCQEDVYYLQIQMKDAYIYEPADVLMVAYPVGPDYLRSTKTIAGILRANHEEKEFRIEPESGFVVRHEETYPDDWKGTVLKESGYEYLVYTSGNYTGEGSAVRKTIKVMWRKDMYKINEFDEYYQEVKGDRKRCYEETEGEHTWCVMEIDVLPYASLKFVFYRNDDFENIIKEMKYSSEFEKSVQVTVVED